MSDDKLIHVVAPEIVTVDDSRAAESLGSPDVIEIGQWYWIRDKVDSPEPQEEHESLGDDDTAEGPGDDEYPDPPEPEEPPEEPPEEWFACVVEVGSNYFEVRSPNNNYERIHFDEFYDRCRFEPDPDSVINRNMKECNEEVARLLGRVKDVTASLSVGASPMLEGSTETTALALRGNQDMEGYSKALAVAKKETLPDLFSQIERANGRLATWMSAKIIPLKAKAGGLKSIIGAIDDRIFSVQLYAGLVETVERVQDGEPAPVGEKIRLYQSLRYMDEECLAQYKVGGMEFDDIGDFDAWLTQPENLNRLLPFPRCVVAFRVRRRDKEREAHTIPELIRIMNKMDADRSTFLYIRNSRQLYRMKTAIEFGPKLFPDMHHSRPTSGRLWAKVYSGGHVDSIITDEERTGMIETYEREEAAYQVRNAAYQAALKSPEALERAKAQGKARPDASCVDVPWPGHGPIFCDHDRYTPYDRSNVYYDDISKEIAKNIKDHNRIVLILQGLLDRSPVLHPHPPWQIWTDEGFSQALEPVYDDSRTLVAGEKPDFEAYRARLNASLKVGSVTIGQEDVWEIDEARKENERVSRDWRSRGGDRHSRYRPYGNPGPGTLAKVAEYSPRTGKCTYAWNRRRLRDNYRDDGPIRATLTCDRDRVLNVSAYKPGDFHIFFDDPRTRVEYLKWAPLLLEAEEYHAGNREVADPPAARAKPRPSWEGHMRYQRRKMRERLQGKAVRLYRDIETMGGTKHKKGSLWRLVGYDRGKAELWGIGEDGQYPEGSDDVRVLRGIDLDDMVLDRDIPPQKGEKDTVDFDDPPACDEEPEDDDADE